MRSNWLNRKKRNLRVMAKRTMLRHEKPAYISGIRPAVGSSYIRKIDPHNSAAGMIMSAKATINRFFSRSSSLSVGSTPVFSILVERFLQNILNHFTPAKQTTNFELEVKFLAPARTCHRLV